MNTGNASSVYASSYPNHKISNGLLIQYFYKELILNDKSTIDEAKGDALMSKMPTEARQPISTMTENAK